MDRKLKALVIDSEPMALDKLRQYVEKTDSLSIVKACADAEEALDYLADNPVDVIFTEVAMPGATDGVRLVESLTAPPAVVFVSAQRAYAAEAYRLSAVDFLLKPYGMPEFRRALRRVEAACAMPCGRAAAPGYLFVRNDKAYDKIALSDIEYISGDVEYLAFHIKGYDRPLREKSSFAAIRRLLTPAFMQIHRSTVINMDHVAKVEKGDVVMRSGARLRVSDANRAWFGAMVADRTVGKKPAPPTDPK